MDGYLILIIGDKPHYRIIYCSSQKEMLTILPQLRATIHGKIEVLNMVGGDTANACKEVVEAEIEL